MRTLITTLVVLLTILISNGQVRIGGLTGIDPAYRMARHNSGLSTHDNNKKQMTDAEIAEVMTYINAGSISQANQEKIKMEILEEQHKQQTINVIIYNQKKEDEKPAMKQRLFNFKKQQADNNNDSARYEVGKMYLNGIGIETNKLMGIAYIKIAASNGNKEAIEFLKKNP
jgi:TPR repeat protein